MARLGKRPTLIQSVELWWYGVALLPILALLYLGFSGILTPLLGLVGLFAFFFWLFSLGFAIWSKLKKPRKDPRP